jgi:hypothetical protein
LFKFKNKELENYQVQNIAITVELGEEFKNKNFRDNQIYAKKQLIKSKIITPLSIECPIDDLVYLQPKFEGETDEGYYIKTEEDYTLLKNLFYEIKKCFKDKVVEVTVHSDYLEDYCNEFSISLDEFLEAYTLD